MTRSGSPRSGSSPRTALSKVARAMPNFCASGHTDCRNAVKAGSGAASAGMPSAATSEAAARRTNLIALRIMSTSMRRSGPRAQVALGGGACLSRQGARAGDDNEARIGGGVSDFQQWRIDVGDVERDRISRGWKLDDDGTVRDKTAAERRDLAAARQEAAAETLHHGRDLLRIGPKPFRVVDAMRPDHEGRAGAGSGQCLDREGMKAGRARAPADICERAVVAMGDDRRAQHPWTLDDDHLALRDHEPRIDRDPIESGPSGNEILHGWRRIEEHRSDLAPNRGVVGRQHFNGKTSCI